MLLKEKIQNDLKEAQMKRDEISISTLRMLIAAINNKEIAKRTKLSKTEPLEKIGELSSLTDEEITDVVMSEVKKRQDAAEGFEKGGRMELADKEKKEAEILRKYLPEQFSEDEIVKLAEEAIAKTDAKEPKDMGKVMAGLMPKVRGKADGTAVTGIVKKLLLELNNVISKY